MDEEETTSVEDAITEIDADEGQPEEIPKDISGESFIEARVDRFDIY